MTEQTSVMTISEEKVERANTLSALVINSPEAEENAINGLTFVQAVLRSTEKARKELVQPLNDEVKKFNTSFKVLKEPFENAERVLKGGLLKWRQAEQKRIEAEQVRIMAANAERERLAREDEEKARKEAEEKARAEAEEAGLDESETAEWVEESTAEVEQQLPAEQEAIPKTPPTTVKSMMGTATIRKTWDFEIEDETQVPRAYMIIDTSKIRIAVRNGIRSIPGVRIFEKENIAGGRNR